MCGLQRSVDPKKCDGSEIAAFDAVKIFILSIAALLAVSGFAQPSKGRNGTGARIFQEQCIGCHGADGRGQTEAGRKFKAADLTSDAVQQQSDSQLSKVVQNGKGKMPTFEGRLSNDEIRTVVGYIRELAKRQ
jgi:cytochrome c6